MNSKDDCLISAKGLWKSFKSGEDEISIIQGLDFSLKQKESISIMGDSGSGKSTLLNLLSGLDRVEKGTLKWRGQSIENFSTSALSNMRRSFIGFVFQSFYLVPDLTVYENLYLSAKIGCKNIGSDEIQSRIDEYLEKVHLTDRKKHSVMTLSGGEKQRVAIARALISDPLIVFADEPTGNLDDRSSKEILELLLSLVEIEAKSLVLVTHNVDFAKYTDKTLYLKNGIFHG
ncbi:MAG: ABC transporter ATP-binding protein [Opitutae bacterium]|nr:ABC transporter ATP-binding protein [Opitutae bacterium]